MSDRAFEFSIDLQSFIQQEIAQGRFRSPSEVVEAALLLLKEREDRLAALRNLIAESERSEHPGSHHGSARR